MPTYEYECEACGLMFERGQAITDPPLTECPDCSGHAKRLVSGGAGFILRAAGKGDSAPHGGPCSLEHSGRTCCGREERCEKPQCHTPS